MGAMPDPQALVGLQHCSTLMCLEQAMDATPDLTVEQSTERHLKLIGKLTKDDSGKYFSAAEDKELPY